MASPGGESLLLKKGDVLTHESVGNNHYVWIVVDVSEDWIAICYENGLVESGGDVVVKSRWERFGWTVI